MRKILFVLIACCMIAAPVMAQSTVNTPVDELSGLSNQQILTVYDALVAEIQKRGIDTSPATVRDPIYVFGSNIHIQTGQLSLCLPTPMPGADTMNQTLLPNIQPTPTSPATTGDRASYDSQTPTDGTHVKAGQTFDITWYLLNTGTTTWTTDYCMRFFTGTNFTKPGKPRYYLENPVAPGTVGACSIDAVAPNRPGTYTMSVVLGNENDENFMIVDITIIVD